MDVIRASSKGQIVIPKAIREALNIRSGTELNVELLPGEGFKVTIQAADHATQVTRLAGSLAARGRKGRYAGLTDDEAGVTEMVNNAIDHSSARKVRVSLQRNALATEVTVADDGEGIFLKIQRALGLADPREAILELAKGKLTTAPEQHTGEGIFFTSRVMDSFDIRSGQLHFRHHQGRRDVLEERTADVAGTSVTMQLANDSTRTLKSVFDEFADPEEYTFDKTVVPVRLAQHEGEKLVSRSQAKRIANRFERFKEVVLDFEGVAEIGQPFADELFRVFAASHPGVRLTPVNTSDAVGQMVRRVASARDAAR